MAIFFTGNEFYDEPGIIEQFHRPFMKKERELTEDDIENGYFDVPEFPDYNLMKRTLTDNFNQKVHHGDMTFHIGDFGNLKVVDELNGDHYLICGGCEYDTIKKKFSGDFEKFRNHVKSRYNFIDVYRTHEMMFQIRTPQAFYKYEIPNTKPLSVKLFMGHMYSRTPKTMDSSPTKQIFSLLNGYLDAKKYDFSDWMLNPGVDVHHFFPITEKDMNEYILEAIEISKFRDFEEV